MKNKSFLLSISKFPLLTVLCLLFISMTSNSYAQTTSPAKNTGSIVTAPPATIAQLQAKLVDLQKQLDDANAHLAPSTSVSAPEPSKIDYSALADSLLLQINATKEQITELEQNQNPK